MNKQAKNFVAGAAILGGIGLICKVIGAFYRIPMTNMIGTQGMAYYQTAYPIYAFLLSISSAGIPVAVSTMVSERVTLGDYASAKTVFNTALKILLVIGLVTTAAMAALSQVLADAAGRSDAASCIMMIAPSLFLVSVMSAYRGYFQGMQRMSPTAFSQLIEQVGKLGLGLLFAYLWLPRGVAWAASGAILGVTLSEALALFFMIAIYGKDGKNRRALMAKSVDSGLPGRPGAIARRLAVIAVPIIIGACAMPLVQVADTAIVTNTLIGMGYTQAMADTMFGTLTSVVNPLVNMPAVLSLALAMSLVPAISASRAKNDVDGMGKKAGFGLKLAMMIGLPCAVGFFLLGGPIIQLLYRSLSESEVATATGLLQIMSIAVLFLTVVQTMTGVLQGLGKQVVPVVALFIGVAVKVAASLIFIRVPDINIYGAAIGTVACYTVAGVIDVVMARKYAHIKLKFVDNFLRPLLATAVMGIVLWLIRDPLLGAAGNTVGTLLCIIACVVVYFAMVLFAGVIRRDDAQFLTGGAKLEKLMTKLKLWK